MNEVDPIQTLLGKLQDALVESTVPSRTTHEVGGFMIMLTPHDPLVWLNYAVPVGTTTQNGLNEMVSIFRSEARSPRL